MPPCPVDARRSLDGQWPVRLMVPRIAAGYIGLHVQNGEMQTVKRTALILEDEPLIAMDLENSLRDVGFDVSIVGTCADATEWLEVCRPDIVIVIVDIELRDGSSHAVVEQLVEDGLPFIVHSGDVADALAGTPYEHGVWLSKPSMPEDLLAAIKQATSAQRQR